MGDAKWFLEVVPVKLPLREPFRIARHTWHEAESVVVTLHHDDTWGRGEGQPSARWEESVERVCAQLRSLDLTSVADPFDLDAPARLLPAGAARCALDIAMHDLAATRSNVSVSEMLGLGGRACPPTSVTLPIAEVSDMVRRAETLAHLPVLKMKVGFDGDVDAVRRVRDVYGGSLRLDANEGWSPDAAIERLHALAALDIELCEQPIPAGDHTEFKRVTHSTDIPVFADEDVCTAEDVAALAAIVDGVNLKLRKTGGIREAVRAARVARELGMGLMLGCNLETGVATTAGAHIASLFDHVDLDGPLLLASDPFPGVTYDAAQLVLPPGPGLGVRKGWAASDEGGA